MTLLWTCAVLRRASASRPLSPGMDRSVMMTSGRSRVAASSSCWPSRTAPTTSKCASFRILARPSVTIAWSSARRTVCRRITPPARRRRVNTGLQVPVHGNRGMHARALIQSRLDADRASRKLGPLGDTHEPQAFASLRVVHIEPTAIIGDRDLRVVVPSEQSNLRAAGARVRHHVAQRFLRDAVHTEPGLGAHGCKIPLSTAPHHDAM